MNTQIDTQKKSDRRSQNNTVINHLSSGKSITASEAIKNYSIYRLAARICDLRKKGHLIKSTTIRSGLTHWSVYFIDTNEREL
jgi:hypothetical protein